LAEVYYVNAITKQKSYFKTKLVFLGVNEMQHVNASRTR